MELTSDQRTAARALGCAFFPATDAQVQRLTMQRRIFWIDGRPVMVSRDGAYYETHATLLAMIEGYRPPDVQQAIEPNVLVPGAATTTQGIDAPVPALARERPVPSGAPGLVQANTTVVTLSEAEALLEPQAPPTPSEPVLNKAGSATAAVDKAPSARVIARRRPKSADTEALTPETQGAPAAIRSASAPVGRTRVIRRSFGYEPPTPRWMVAGKLRRGRLR